MFLLGPPALTPFGLLGLVLLGFKVFAFVDALSRPDALFRAADKQHKNFWLAILGAAAAWNALEGGVVTSLGFLNLIGLVATIVYLVDVRPALRAFGGGRGKGGQIGPYGPW